MGTGFKEKGKSLQHQELISSAEFSNNFKQYHIAKHDVYGNDFIQPWENSCDFEISPEDFELMNNKLYILTFKHYVYRNDFM